MLDMLHQLPPTCLLRVCPLAQHIKAQQRLEFKWVSGLSAPMWGLISVPTSHQRPQPRPSNYIVYNIMPGKTELSLLTTWECVTYLTCSKQIKTTCFPSNSSLRPTYQAAVWGHWLFWDNGEITNISYMLGIWMSVILTDYHFLRVIWILDTGPMIGGRGACTFLGQHQRENNSVRYHGHSGRVCHICRMLIKSSLSDFNWQKGCEIPYRHWYKTYECTNVTDRTPVRIGHVRDLQITRDDFKKGKKKNKSGNSITELCFNLILVNGNYIKGCCRLTVNSSPADIRANMRAKKRLSKII